MFLSFADKTGPTLSIPAPASKSTEKIVIEPLDEEVIIVDPEACKYDVPSDNLVREPDRLGDVNVFVVLLKVNVESVPSAEPPSLNCISVSDPAAPAATPEDVIVIEPSEFVIEIFVPAVKVAAAGPDVPPINNAPFVVIGSAIKVSVPLSCVMITDLSAKDVAPVPPCATVTPDTDNCPDPAESPEPAIPDTKSAKLSLFSLYESSASKKIKKSLAGLTVAGVNSKKSGTSWLPDMSRPVPAIALKKSPIVSFFVTLSSASIKAIESAPATVPADKLFKSAVN